MADIRLAAENDPSLKIKWKESMECTQFTVRNRFLRLSLKDKPMQAIDPVRQEEIDLLKRHLRELFPDMDVEKLQKVHTSKVVDYNEWLEKHTRPRHYSFQIRKCEDCSCCSEPQNKNLARLPDPVLDESVTFPTAHSNPPPLQRMTDLPSKNCLKLERPRESPQMLVLKLPAQLIQ